MLSKIVLICPKCNLKGASFDILEAPAGAAKSSILRSKQPPLLRQTAPILTAVSLSLHHYASLFCAASHSFVVSITMSSVPILSQEKVSISSCADTGAAVEHSPAA